MVLVTTMASPPFIWSLGRGDFCVLNSSACGQGCASGLIKLAGCWGWKAPNGVIGAIAGYSMACEDAIPTLPAATDGTPVEAALIPGGCRGGTGFAGWYLCRVKHGPLALNVTVFTAGWGVDPTGYGTVAGKEDPAVCASSNLWICCRASRSSSSLSWEVSSMNSRASACSCRASAWSSSSISCACSAWTSSSLCFHSFCASSWARCSPSTLGSKWTKGKFLGGKTLGCKVHSAKLQVW